MTDRLAALLTHFSVSAEVFHAGTLCGLHRLDDGDRGQLHLLREGSVVVHNGDGQVLRIDRPSLLLYPQAMPHRFEIDAQRGADFACAHLRFSGGAANPLVRALPACICLPLDALRQGEALLHLLFEEAFAQHCGRQAVLNRLFEVVLVHVIRELMEQGLADGGMLAGMADARLRLALTGIHDAPAQPWTLESLAARAGMSRSAFARSFRETLGCTPGQYLQDWRIALVQRGLREGRPLKQLADEVGYGSEAAVSRVFKAQVGQTPRAWRQAR
ncbi:AraC family transcriptional regulator [Xanthomonas sp. 3307]|uniref:AraC family transcriptional regulator n=1 Tax=Xanthomonas sp. 3307 TaxID=3035316 RepID=UPI00160C08C2|nr:AraC family transcriptional regulator [Xanthomonas sp. 3307]MBB5942562.1 AraC-like DNA-binding protein [Xanthomonas sp. 3307]